MHIRAERLPPFEIMFNARTERWLLIDAMTVSEHDTLLDAQREQASLERLIEQAERMAEALV